MSRDIGLHCGVSEMDPTMKLAELTDGNPRSSMLPRIFVRCPDQAGNPFSFTGFML
jgi:hypothetical protein